jgi:predicted transcriptional regulator
LDFLLRFKEDKSILKAKYRNRTEILVSVLVAAKGAGASKTRIMFNAYLSYEQLNEYLNELLDKELLTYDLHTRPYHIAPKGSKFLELYSELDKIQ